MPTMNEFLGELERRRGVALKMGGEEKVQKQHDRGKLTCRERIDLLFDPGSFIEFGMLGQHAPFIPQMEGKHTPADGVVTGYGKINGRYVGVAAYDFTVLGGSIGHVGEMKVTRLREKVLKERIPIVWLIDSVGARVHEFSALAQMFAGTGHLFQEQVVMSGVVPQVCAVMGPGAAGTAYIPGLADWVIMVKGKSSLALGGPPLVKAVTGEEISEEDLGGAKIHTEVSGVADLAVEDDKTCIETIRRYLSYFPSHCQEKPPRIPNEDPIDRADEELLHVLPDNPRRAYDMHKVIDHIIDRESFLEVKPRFARNIITGFARMGGFSVGIVASQPMFLGGVLDNDASDKAARFINLCDAFNIPLLFLQDVPGFMVGSKTERVGLIRHGAKMLYAVSEATVPKVTVVVRKAYGAGYYVMCGKAFEPDMIFAWPTAEISLMGPEGMVNILARREHKDSTPEERDQMTEQIRAMINPFLSAELGQIDDVIDPRETRKKVIHALELTQNKTVERPWKKHGVVPV